MRSLTGGVNCHKVREWDHLEGDNQYRLTVRVIDGNMIDYQHFFFWVIDDGGPGETAYFEYRDPTADPGGGRIDIFGT